MAKRILLTNNGSRGDVQPAVVLGAALLEAGYRVRIVAPDAFRDWIEGKGLEFYPSGFNLPAIIEAPEGRRKLQSGRGRLRLSAGRDPLTRDMLERSAEALTRASEDVDGLIYGPLVPFATNVAEARNIPAMAYLIYPAFTTGEFASPVADLPFYSLGSWVNRLTHAIWRLGLLYDRRKTNRLRAKHLDLGPLRRPIRPFYVAGEPIPVLVCTSPAVTPRPADWPDRVKITGYWFNDEGENWTPPTELADFLSAEPPPYVVGFGSLPVLDAPGAVDALIQAAQHADRRLLFLQGSAGPSHDKIKALGEKVHVAHAAPYDWLLPRVGAMIHHGGAGTTADCLRAGIPSMVSPLGFDNKYWGRVIHRLGCGPAPLPAGKWTAARLGASIAALTETETYRTEAARMSRLIAQDDGIAVAIEEIERYIGKP